MFFDNKDKIDDLEIKKMKENIIQFNQIDVIDETYIKNFVRELKSFIHKKLTFELKKSKELLKYHVGASSANK